MTPRPGSVVGAHPLGGSRYVDLGGHRLHCRMSGGGDTTVVFEAGLGMSGVTWGLVAPAIAGQARAVVYDRGGIAASDDAPHPRTLERLATDLGALLRDLPGPFVLVGHSWGGPIVRLLASRGEADIRCLVLVDPSDERDDEFFTNATGRRMALAGPITKALAAVGVYRAAARMGRALPPRLYRQFRDENFGRRGARALAGEVRHFLPGLAALRAAPPDLRDLPVTILSGTAGALRRAHAESAAALARGRLVAVDGAGHNVMLNRPGPVIEEILRTL